VPSRPCGMSAEHVEHFQIRGESSGCHYPVAHTEYLTTDSLKTLYPDRTSYLEDKSLSRVSIKQETKNGVYIGGIGLLHIKTDERVPKKSCFNILYGALPW